MKKFLILLSITLLSSFVSAQEFYVDKESGQVFTKPGPNRVKMDEPDQPRKKVISDFIKSPLPAGFSNTPEKPIEEKLTIVGRVQFRGVSGQRDTIWSNGHSDFNAVDMNFRRVRFGFMYQGAKWWGTSVAVRLEDLANKPYTVQQKTTIEYLDSSITKQSATLVQDVAIKDNRGGLQEANIFINIPFWGSRVIFGQLPMAYAREWQQSSANLVTVERSHLTNTVWQMDIGTTFVVQPLGELIDKKYERFLQIQGGIYNGHGSGLDGAGRSQGLTNNYSNTKPLLLTPMYTWRVQFQPFGGLVRDGKDVGWHEGEEIFQKDMKLSIGLGGLETKNLFYSPSLMGINQPGIRGIDTIQTFITQNQPDNGYGLGGSSAYGNGIVNTIPTSVSNQLLTPTNIQTSINRPSFGLVGRTHDFTFTVNGFYLSGQYSLYSGSASKQNRTGQITVGYNFRLGMDYKFYLMPVLRADFINGDWNVDQKIDGRERFKTYWVGLNLFGDGHLFKAQLFYEVFRNKLGSDPVTFEPKAVRGDTIYFQLQATFWTGAATKDTWVNLHD
jgi:hypothetical protein